MHTKIIEKATEMYLTFGFKSVTMDDIASKMGISKKTIYQHFENKTDLVEAVTMHLFDTISCGIDDIQAQSQNPIEELFTIKNFILKNLKNESASPIYQLKKYYPQIHKSLTSRQFEKMGDCVFANLRQGIELELYRNDINLELIGRFYFAGMTSIKDAELFNPIQFSSKDVQEVYLEYHVRGIATPKGIAVLEQLISK
jgi:AcrR family transcriptional regulator